jgi:O-methyltransferase
MLINKLRLRRFLGRPVVQENTVEAAAQTLYIPVNHSSSLPLGTPPAYAQDSLISWHNTEFMQDPQFQQAYDSGKATNSWGGYEIQWRVHVLCWAAARAARMEGDFVECGVNRGGFSRAVIDYVNFESLDKTFYLMDTFSGLVPELVSEDEKNAGIMDIYGKYYEDCFEAAQETFRPFQNVVLVRGPIPDTLASVTPSKVAYLSIDMNSATPEIAAAEYFWERMVSGSVMILDDYGHLLHRYQKKAFDDFAVQRDVQVLMLPTGQGLIFKP